MTSMKFTENKKLTKTKVYEPYELTKLLRYTRKTIIYRETNVMCRARPGIRAQGL